MPSLYHLRHHHFLHVHSLLPTFSTTATFCCHIFQTSWYFVFDIAPIKFFNSRPSNICVKLMFSSSFFCIFDVTVFFFVVLKFSPSFCLCLLLSTHATRFQQDFKVSSERTLIRCSSSITENPKRLIFDCSAFSYSNFQFILLLLSRDGKMFFPFHSLPEMEV